MSGLKRQNSANMNVLITVEFYYMPGGGGIAEQARQIAEGLARFGHKVIVATSDFKSRAQEINGVAIKGFSVFGNAVKGIGGEIENYKNFLLSDKFDAMINFAANVWTTDLAFEVQNNIKAIKILSTPGLSKLSNPKYLDYCLNTYVPSLKNYDRIAYTSPHYRDKLFGDEQGLADKTVIIPNGASREEFLKPSSINFREKFEIKTKYLAITVANHFFAKGHNFVIQALSKMNRKDITLAIIGSKPARHSWYSCYFTCLAKSFVKANLKIISGLSREMVLSVYKQADLFLFGSRLECSPLVMYESFAARVPFITTNVGNVADHREFLRIVATPKEMAQVSTFLLDHSKEKSALTEKAYQLWQQGYTWDAIAAKYDSILRSKHLGLWLVRSRPTPKAHAQSLLNDKVCFHP